MSLFCCYDNCDVMKTLLMINFHLYLIKLWWQFFQMFVYGDVVIRKIGRYWPWKTVIVSSHLRMPVRPTLLHRMALVSFLLFRKNLGNLRELIAGWSNTAEKPTVGLSYQTKNTRLEDANFVQGVQECLSKKLALRARTLNAAQARYTPNYKHDAAEKWKKEKAK